jgi:hypothetical protein
MTQQNSSIFREQKKSKNNLQLFEKKNPQNNNFLTLTIAIGTMAQRKAAITSGKMQYPSTQTDWKKEILPGGMVRKYYLNTVKLNKSVKKAM